MPPLTGIVELYGPEIAWAGQLAAQEINTAGGVLGRPLELVIEDDGSMPDSALQAATRLLDRHGCEALIGNLLSNSRIAVADQIAEVRGVPYLNFSFYEGSISGRFFFHFAALPNQQIERMIPYMAERYGLKMFFAGNNYEWPRGSIDAAKRSLWALGGEVVGEDYLPLGLAQQPIDRLLEQVATSGADVFVPYFAGRDQILLLNSFAARGLKQRMAVVMGHYDEAMARMLSPEVRAGLYSSNTYFMSVENERARAYLQRLRAHPEVDDLWPRGRGVLTNFGEAAYCCVHAYAQAVAAAGATAPEAVVTALEQVRVDSCQGEVRMDPASHHAEVNSYLACCRRDGTFALIESFGRIAPRIPERYRPPDASQVSAAMATQASSGTRLRELPQPGSYSSISDIFGQILDLADVAVIATDAEGQILQANLGAARLFGYPLEEFTGLSVHWLLPPHQRQRHRALLHRFEQSPVQQMPMGHRGEIAGYRKDGTLFPAEASISKFIDDGRSVLVATLRDISAKKDAEQQLHWQATHDTLTQLPNRALIRERLEHALQRSEHSQRWVAVLSIDLDQFKLINDNYGHDIGDQALIRVAKLLLERVRAGDMVGRLGADEFVVLCEYNEDREAASHLAERINQVLRLPLRLAGQELICTASIGIALGRGREVTADALLRNADLAMNASKEQGRDGWRLFSEELNAQTRARLQLVNGLRHAIARDELSLVYQPIVAAGTLRIQGAEALLRWQPEDGPVSPALFVPIAEQSGSIVAIGRWVFEQVCETQQRLARASAEHPPYLSVNLSAVQLNDERIVEDFTEILKRTGADPGGLLLELTETSLFADVEKNLRILHQLAALGMRVAVDDFGTGYSSLLQLLRLPVASIKIDREFIDGIDKRTDARLIVSAMIKMGKALGKHLIAEGVENEIQLFELQALQCEAIQGFYLHRPMPEPDFFATLAHNRQQSLSDAPKIYQVVYLSQASTGRDTPQIEDIVAHARARNREQGITGFLIYQNGYFLQLLEGRQEIVEALMARIVSDPRHREPLVVVSGHARYRLFSDWDMGYWDMDAPSSEQEDVLGRQNRAFSLLKASEDTRFCYALFEALSAAV